MLQQALQKLQAEVGANAKDKMVQIVGGFLMNYVRNNPERAELIAAEGKTIKGSVKAMEDEARKQQVNQQAILTDEEGFTIVLKYYGVELPKPEPEPVAVGFNVDLDELL